MSKMLKVVGASWLQTKISSYILGLLGVLAILALFVGQIERIQEDGNFTATVFYSKKTGYSIEYWGQSNKLSDIQKGVARAHFRMDIDTTGWSLLEIETDGSYPDDIQAYAAGIVEGALTWYPIHSHLDNTVRSTCAGREKQCDKLKDALERSVNIWKANAAQHKHKDPFWHQVYLYYTQLRGVYTGWKHGVERSLNEYETDISDLYWLNAFADVKEIQRKLNISVENSELNDVPSLDSALLRVVDQHTQDGKNFKKLFVAQNSAGSYASMTRILKRYKLHYHLTDDDASPPAPGNSVEFSGYPGSITSQDEFYIVRGERHRLVVAGTPLNNYNSRLWKDVNITEQLPVGPRVTAANHLAVNVSSWGRTLAASNSGTACKQWLIADLAFLDKQRHNDKTLAKKPPTSTKVDVVTEVSVGGKNKDVKHTVVHRASSNAQLKGLFWLVEQVPGRTHSADLSDVLLEQGYWSTYGLPFFQDIADLTHVTNMYLKYGEIFSVSESPRAKAFKKGYLNATSKDSIIYLMRQNNLTEMKISNDTSSDQDVVDLKDKKYWSVLGIRLDVSNKHKLSYGVIDTKIASGVSNGDSIEFLAISGPPYTIKNGNSTTESTQINKGNLAPIYTDKFIDETSISGMEIRDLVKHYMEKTDAVPEVSPFQWSTSEFKNESHEGLPDTWAFEPFVLKWSW